MISRKALPSPARANRSKSSSPRRDAARGRCGCSETTRLTGHALSSRIDRDHAHHIGVIAAIITDLPYLFEGGTSLALRLDRDIEAVAAIRRGVDDDIGIRPFDGISDMGRDFGRREGR